MFDIGWSELLVIGVVALIVVGPKDLPRMFRTLGEVTGKARKMAREFQGAMNDAARESGMDDVKADLRKLSNPKKYGIDKLREATGEFSAWSPDAADGKVRQGLSPERAASKAKTGAATAARAQARLDSDAAELSDEPDELLPDPAAPEPAGRKPGAATAPASGTTPAKPAGSKASPKAASVRSTSASKAASPKAASTKPAAPKSASSKAPAPKKAAAPKSESAKADAAKPSVTKSASKPAARKSAAAGPADPAALEPAETKGSGGSA